MRVMPSFLQHCSTGVSQCNESWQKGNGLCIQAVKWAWRNTLSGLPSSGQRKKEKLQELSGHSCAKLQVPDAEGAGNVTLINAKWSRNKSVSFFFTVFINTRGLCIWWVSLWYLHILANVCCLWPATHCHPCSPCTYSLCPSHPCEMGEFPVLGLEQSGQHKKEWLGQYWVSIPSKQFRAYKIDPISW